MKKKYSLTLDDEFIGYCKLNNIDNIEEFAKETFNKGFTMVKYGELPIGIVGVVNKGKNEFKLNVVEDDVNSPPVEKSRDLYDE